MKLVYSINNDPVQLGDLVTLSDGTEVKIHYFRKPHKPESSGKVTVQEHGTTREYFVSVIGAKWIDREDQR